VTVAVKFNGTLTNRLDKVCNDCMSDAELIDKLGGPARVCELLGLVKSRGVQRVHNWKSRGIPAEVKLSRPDLFLPGWRAAAPEFAEAHHAA